MILYARVENYRSIGKQQVLSSYANSDKSHIENLLDQGADKILPVIPIYGGNATGKTNILKFLRTMQEIINGENELFKYYEPCKFLKEQATTLEIIYVKNNIKYYYSIQYNNKNIIEEKLYYYPNGRISKIFNREEINRYSFGNDFEGILNKYSADTPDDMSFLKFSNQWLKGKIKEIDDSKEFFTEDLIFLGFDFKDISLKNSIKLLKESKNKKEADKFINFFYKHMNTGAKGFKIASLKEESKEKIIKELIKNDNLKDNILKNNKINLNDDLLKEVLLNSIEEDRLEIIYNIRGKDIPINIYEESKGIQKIFKLGVFFSDALCNGKTIIFDELETSFHPILSKIIIKLFLKNSKNSQLIFTTHDTSLLDLDLFRRDQIYFTSRTKETDFQTEIKSLSEIPGIRKTTDIEKGYLQGNYCTAPKDEDFPEEEILGDL